MSVRRILIGAATAAAVLIAAPPSTAHAAQSGDAPYGSLESVEAVGGQIRVTGYAIDPDGPGASYVQIDVIGGSSHTVFASEYRGDVGYHGFDYTIDAGAGSRTVCVTALDYDHEAPDTSLGCGSVTLPAGPS